VLNELVKCKEFIEKYFYTILSIQRFLYKKEHLVGHIFNLNDEKILTKI
jgi:hypothetical protein